METLPYGPRLGRSSLRKLQSPADPVSQRESPLFSTLVWVSSVQFSHSVVSDPLRPRRLPCHSLSPGVCLNSCPLSWCHPTISSYTIAPFSSFPQSFLASGSFPVSWLFVSGSQSIGASPSASTLLMNIQGWFALGLTSLISLLSKGLSRVFSSTTVWKHQFFGAQPSLQSKSQLWLYRPLLAKWCLCFLFSFYLPLVCWPGPLGSEDC